MFQTFHKDKPYPIPAGTLTDNAFEYDKVTICTKIWTDGSYKDREGAGWGFWTTEHSGIETGLCGRLPGRKQTNNRAEL